MNNLFLFRKNNSKGKQKNSTLLLALAIIIYPLSYSCQSSIPIKDEFPIVYFGVDTIYYKDDPTIDFSILTNILTISKDSLKITFETHPFAPVDSSYGIHGSLGQYYTTYHQTKVEGIIMAQWDFDFQEEARCTHSNLPTIEFIGKQKTVIDTSKDSLCIGNIVCIKQ
jgi:hypothetical protein